MRKKKLGKKFHSRLFKVQVKLSEEFQCKQRENDFFYFEFHEYDDRLKKNFREYVDNKHESI